MSSSDKDTPMDTSDQPGGGSSEPPGSITDLQPKKTRKFLMECPDCNVKFDPSVRLIMEKNDKREFTIDLYKENGDDNTPITKTIPITEMSTGTVDGKHCTHCKYSVATRVNNFGGFDVEVSIKIPKENQLEAKTMDAQPATQDILVRRNTDEPDEPSTWRFPKLSVPTAWKKSRRDKSEETNQTKSQGSSFPSFLQTRTTVKVHCIATGETFGAIDTIKKQLKIKKELSSQFEETNDRGECNIIIFFCPIYRCVESEVKTAMEETAVSSSGKQVILVLMHHTRDPDYSTAAYDGSEVSKNVMCYVHVLYHETTPGLLTCKQNDQAIKTIKEKLQTYKQ